MVDILNVILLRSLITINDGSFWLRILTTESLVNYFDTTVYVDLFSVAVSEALNLGI